MEMIGLPILLAALLGFVIFGGDDADTEDNGASGESGDGGEVLGGEGLQPTDENDDGSLTPANDIFNALAGDDRVEAGDGNDSVFGDAGDDTLFGQLGNDALNGGAGDDSLFGGFGDDVLSDDSGAIFMLGEGGDDTLAAANGAGRMFGGDGDDAILAVDADVTILGGAGTDVVAVSGGEAIKVFGNDGDDLILTDDTSGQFLSGDAGDDRIAGVGGRINGGAGEDVLASRGSFDEDAADETNGPRTALYGGEGDDAIWGVEGNTIMTGGEGADDFHNQDRATIEDFTPGTDTLTIELVYDDSNIGAGGVVIDDQDFAVVLTEIDINGAASTLVETQIVAIPTSTVDVTNLNQSVWLKGVTPDQIADADIDITIIGQSTLDQILDETFAPA